MHLWRGKVYLTALSGRAKIRSVADRNNGSRIFATLARRFASGFGSLAPCLRLVRHEDGATAVEFALLAAPFLMITVTLLQGSVIFLADQVLEIGAAEASRLILTGQAQNEGLTQSTFANAVCGKVPVLFNCNNLMIDVQAPSTFASANTSAPDLTYNSNGEVTNTWQYNPGNPGDIVVVRVMYEWPLAGLFANLTNGDRLLMATAVFKNEPYLVTGP
jgi:Flp pilus assembly protein TadG